MAIEPRGQTHRETHGFAPICEARKFTGRNFVAPELHLDRATFSQNSEVVGNSFPVITGDSASCLHTFDVAATSGSELVAMVRALGQRLDRLEILNPPSPRELKELFWFLRDLGLSARSNGYLAYGAMCLEVAERTADQATVGRAFLLWVHAWQQHSANYLRSPKSRHAVTDLVRIMNHGDYPRSHHCSEIEGLIEALRL